MNAKKLRALEDIFLNKGVVKPPKGFFTRSEIAKAWKVTEQTANRKLKKFVASSLMEVKYFKVRSGQVVRPVPHYKIISK